MAKTDVKMPMGALAQSSRSAKALAKSGVRFAVGRDAVTKYYAGPPLGHPSLEFLFGLTVFPYSSIVHLYGPPSSGKSTIGFDWLKMFCIDIGGRGVLVENEQKLSADVLYGVIGEEHADSLVVANVEDLEGTQSALTVYSEELLLKTFGKQADRSHAYCQLNMVDSFRVLCRATKDKLKKNKHATAAFAVEANLWRQYLGVYTGMQSKAPLGLIVTNHMVEKTNQMGMTVETAGGGKALNFYSAYEIAVKKVQKKEDKKFCYTDICLRATKNSNTTDKRKVYPRIWYKSPDIEPGRFVVDWNIADALLLSGSLIPRDLLAKEDICNVKMSSSNDMLFNDPILGVKNAPIEEVVAALYADEKRLQAFRKALSISSDYHTFEELWSQGWYFDAKQLNATSKVVRTDEMDEDEFDQEADEEDEEMEEDTE